MQQGMLDTPVVLVVVEDAAQAACLASVLDVKVLITPLLELGEVLGVMLVAHRLQGITAAGLASQPSPQTTLWVRIWHCHTVHDVYSTHRSQHSKARLLPTSCAHEHTKTCNPRSTS